MLDYINFTALFGKSTFMEQLYDENNKLSKMLQKQQYNVLLSSFLLKLWSGLGYDGSQAIAPKARKGILIKIRFKVIQKRPHIFVFEKKQQLKRKKTQFDASKAFQAIMDTLVNKCMEHHQHWECFELIRFETRSYSYCLGCMKQGHPQIEPTDYLSGGLGK